MKTAAKIGLGLGGAAALLVGVIAVRTATFKAPAAADLSGVKLAPAFTVDRALAAQHLSQAIQIWTISHQDRADDQPAEWDRLHAWLQATYPAAHAAMGREVVAGHTLIY
ncbi:MAG: peptidase M20, partial [Pseudomonadota bacterium]